MVDFPDDVPPPTRLECPEKMKHHLRHLTSGKRLNLYKDGEVTITFRMNRTVRELVKKHCENESIEFGFFITAAVVDYMTYHKIISLALPEKYYPCNRDDEYKAQRFKTYRRRRKSMKGYKPPKTRRRRRKVRDRPGIQKKVP
jgi:hypothetical protein